MQLFNMLLVQIAIPIDLLMPELLASDWPFEQVAVVAMPEAAMNKYHSPVFRKNEVGFTGQSFVMQSVSEAQPMKPASD